MLFNSYIFLFLFLPICLALYYILHKAGAHTGALLGLLGMSLWFYGYFNYKYLIILCGSIGFNWCISRSLYQVEGTKKKVLLTMGIISDAVLIFYFKYYDFFLSNLNGVLGTSYAMKNILLPLGISFFTFQQISYLVDSYQGETSDYHFLEYAVYVSFFPQLIAGPIVLHSEMIPQLRDKKNWYFQSENFAHGIFAVSVGLFKKVILADTFGRGVAWAWGNLQTLSSVEIMVVMLSYTFQIYFDFSGYCDMAVGLGKMFNIDLPINFNSPYKSCSIIEFWKRWHLTLTRFLRTYIYYPLGGSKKGRCRTYLNVMVVFLVSGIWHGANWTFIVWGLIHGVANVLNRIFKNVWDKCHSSFRWITTFLFLNITWLIFRAERLEQAGNLLVRLVKMDSIQLRPELGECFKLPEFYILEQLVPWRWLSNQVQGLYMWIFLAAAMFICLKMQNIHQKAFVPTYRKALAAIIMFVWCVMSFTGVSTFLYFNF